MPGFDFDSPTIEVEGSGGGNTTFTIPNAADVTRAFVPGQALTIVGTTATTVEVEGDHTAERRVFLLNDAEYQQLQDVTVGPAGGGVVAPQAAGAIYIDSWARAVGVHEAVAGRTAFAYPGNPADVTGVVLESGVVLMIAATGDGEVLVTGNYDGTVGYVGVGYGMALDLARPAVRGENGVALLAEGLTYGRTVVVDSYGGYRLTAMRTDGPDRSWERVWSSGPGKLVAAVRGLADRTTLRISDSSPNPLRIVTAEITARRTRRIL